jgi:hypothetical protein
MALPTSGPLSINAIRVELGASSTNQSLGAFSDTAGFAAPDAISDFYGFSSLKSAYRYNGTVGKPAFECDISRAITTQFWHNGSNLLPANGDTCYLSTNTSGFKLPNGNYSIFPTSYTGTPMSVITISGGSGVISQATLCVL